MKVAYPCDIMKAEVPPELVTKRKLTGSIPTIILQERPWKHF
jgi:hypothetical protein